METKANLTGWKEWGRRRGRSLTAMRRRNRARFLDLVSSAGSDLSRARGPSFAWALSVSLPVWK
jgi:hypothetical protein